MSALSIWTIYDHPSDFPNSFVARRFEADRDGSRPTPDVMISPNLDAIRDQMVRRGLTCLCRNENDDPKIVEVWL